MPKADVKLEIPSSPYGQLGYWTNGNRNPAPSSYVYVLQAAGDTPIKVGKATDVLDRIGQIQTGNPRRIQLLAVVVGEEALEKFWHHELREHRLVGEWFDGPSIPAFVEKVAEIAKQMVADYQSTKRLPDFTDYVEWKPRAKRRRKPPVAPVTTTYVAPQPLSAEEVQKNLWRREKERFHRVKMPDDFTHPEP